MCFLGYKCTSEILIRFSVAVSAAASACLPVYGIAIGGRQLGERFARQARPMGKARYFRRQPLWACCIADSRRQCTVCVHCNGNGTGGRAASLWNKKASAHNTTAACSLSLLACLAVCKGEVHFTHLSLQVSCLAGLPCAHVAIPDPMDFVCDSHFFSHWIYRVRAAAAPLQSRQFSSFQLAGPLARLSASPRLDSAVNGNFNRVGGKRTAASHLQANVNVILLRSSRAENVTSPADRTEPSRCKGNKVAPLA